MKQLELFSKPIFSSNKKIRLIENFSGIGCQALALKYLGLDFEHYRSIEFDKFPVASYNAIHGTDFKPMDICKTHAEDWNIIDSNSYLYIVTYSFPCIDISLAGQRKGMSKEDWLNGTSTRSGLLWEFERILYECKNLTEKDKKYSMPDILIMENVTQVHRNKNAEDFNNWCSSLNNLGYSNYWNDCNAKNFGVAQNRDRTFMVSIKGDYDFEFPKEIPLTHVMADYLDENVDEKYFINNEKAESLIQNLIDKGALPEIEDE